MIYFLTVENEKPDLILLTEVLSKSCSIFAKFVIPGFYCLLILFQILPLVLKTCSVNLLD